MFGLKSTGRQTWKRTFRYQLSEYVTQVAWSPNGCSLAACSAAGEIVLIPFQNAVAGSIECLASSAGPIERLAFSADGQFLATGDQTGQVRIWSCEEQTFVPLLTHHRSGYWIEHLCWHPTQPLLAFNVGHTTEILNVTTQAVVATLDFENSSVLCLAWHPSKGLLMVGGYQGIKVWNSQDWQEEPLVVALDSASLAIAWSPDEKYLASGNLDRTITVLEWPGEHPNSKPWVMRGFPGKIRHLAWSPLRSTESELCLAAASIEGVVIWERDPDPLIGWNGYVLESHTQAVEAIAFQPQTQHLASAGADGLISLWHNATRLTQTLNDAPKGFSGLSWHPQGQFLAAGGSQGELFIWTQTQAAKGFAKT